MQMKIKMTKCGNYRDIKAEKGARLAGKDLILTGHSTFCDRPLEFVEIYGMISLSIV